MTSMKMNRTDLSTFAINIREDRNSSIPIYCGISKSLKRRKDARHQENSVFEINNIFSQRRVL